MAGATCGSGSDGVAVALSAVSGALACHRASDRELGCGSCRVVLRVECHGDAPQHRLALVDIAAAGRYWFGG